MGLRFLLKQSNIGWLLVHAIQRAFSLHRRVGFLALGVLLGTEGVCVLFCDSGSTDVGCRWLVFSVLVHVGGLGYYVSREAGIRDMHVKEGGDVEVEVVEAEGGVAGVKKEVQVLVGEAESEAAEGQIDVVFGSRGGGSGSLYSGSDFWHHCWLRSRELTTWGWYGRRSIRRDKVSLVLAM